MAPGPGLVELFEVAGGATGIVNERRRTSFPLLYFFGVMEEKNNTSISTKRSRKDATVCPR
jgi:hypothetical protein